MCTRDRSPTARAALILETGRFKDVQSGAYAPPKRLPTRSPPINRDLTIPLAASHTLTRVAEANPPRRGRPASPHSRDDDEDHPCGQLSPCYLQHTPSCPTFLHSGGQEAPNSLSGAPEQVVEAAPLLSLCRSSAPGTHRLRCQLEHEGLPHVNTGPSDRTIHQPCILSAEARARAPQEVARGSHMASGAGG